MLLLWMGREICKGGLGLLGMDSSLGMVTVGMSPPQGGGGGFLRRTTAWGFYITPPFFRWPKF